MEEMPVVNYRRDAQYDEWQTIAQQVAALGARKVNQEDQRRDGVNYIV